MLRLTFRRSSARNCSITISIRWRFFAAGPRVFLHYYHAYVYVRVMQALGAYGFRGFYESKPVFCRAFLTR